MIYRDTMYHVFDSYWLLVKIRNLIIRNITEKFNILHLRSRF